MSIPIVKAFLTRNFPSSVKNCRQCCECACVHMSNAVKKMKKCCVADRKVITLLMDMKAQMQVLAHQQQQIMSQLAKNGNFGGKPTPKLPDGIVLPLQVIDQLMTLERKITRSFCILYFYFSFSKYFIYCLCMLNMLFQQLQSINQSKFIFWAITINNI